MPDGGTDVHAIVTVTCTGAGAAGQAGDVKALQGRDGYRLRIGSYRVIFDEDATTILAIYIGHRATTTYTRNYHHVCTTNHSGAERRRAGGAAAGRI